jgi:cell wall-associated NlpC family hydrolase/putative cell wall-binding protein
MSVRPRPSTRGAAVVLLATAASLVALGTATGAAFGGAAPKPAPASAPAPAPAATPHPLPTTVRLSGPDRYATAAAVSAATFPAGAPVAYLATGSDYPDALTAAAAAGGRGPVLLAAASLPAATVAELTRLRPARVVIVGGTGGLPATTEAAVHAALPGATISRIAGSDRYSTAAAVASATFTAPVPVAWVATGEGFADALSAAAAAGGRGPVLLVPHTGVPLATTFALGSLRPARVWVVGGTGAIAAQTQATLAALLPHATVARVAGADRYATAVAVSNVAYPTGATTAYLATGAAFPDALTAAAAAAGHGPVLLVGSSSAPPVVMGELERLRPPRLVLVGGGSAVGDALVQQVNSVLSGTATTTSTSPSTTSSTTAPATTTSSTAAPTTTAPRTTAAPTTTAPRTTTTPTTAPTTPQAVGPVTTTTGLAAPAAPPPPPSPLAAVAVATAEAQLGKPYQWAGAGPASFDCSGLTMFAWAAAGVALPHNAAAQQELLPAVTPDAAHLAPGDLLFYDTPVDHVAMYVGGGMMVEAAHSGVPVREVPVRTDSLVGAGRP